jgi:hypothetical protein
MPYFIFIIDYNDLTKSILYGDLKKWASGQKKRDFMMPPPNFLYSQNWQKKNEVKLRSCSIELKNFRWWLSVAANF